MGISGILAIGNGENCPFCNKQNIQFIIDKDTDIIKHMIDEHKNDFNSHLFGGNYA